MLDDQKTGVSKKRRAAARLARPCSATVAICTSYSAGVAGIGSLTGYADTLLGASRDVYGSGAGYVSDFSRVVDALERVTSQGVDALTASAMKVLQETATTTLVAQLEKVVAELSALRVEVQQGSGAPLRAAA